MDNQNILSKLKSSNKYQALCDFDPKNEDIFHSNNGTLSSPSTPKVTRKTAIATTTISGQLEKCSSEPSVNSTKSEKKTSKSEQTTLLPLQLFLSFQEGDEFERLCLGGSKHWWPVRALQGDKEVGYVPSNYLVQITLSEDEDNENLEIPRSEDAKALQELHAKIKNLRPGLQGGMIPEPDFPPPMPELRRDNDGLILPRKPNNPCVDSGDHKNLHRELLFNQKVGKNVLNQKSELQRAMEKHREQAARKEAEKEKTTNKTAFEKVIEERARRLETLERQEEEERTVDAKKPEFLQVHAKLRARMDSK